MTREKLFQKLSDRRIGAHSSHNSSKLVSKLNMHGNDYQDIKLVSGSGFPGVSSTRVNAGP